MLLAGCAGHAPSEPAAATLVLDPAAFPDSDGDRVADSADKCQQTKACEYSLIGPDGCPVPFYIDLKGVTFAKNSTELSPDAIAILKDSLEGMQCWDLVRIRIEGHAETCEKDAVDLSRRRAEVVDIFLRSHGLAPARIEGVIGHGDKRPLADPTVCGMEFNRSAELLVY